MSWGVFGWLFCRLSARVWGVPEVHLFTTLANAAKRLFWPWLPFSGILLKYGRLPETDTELAILRVGHLRGSEYELQQHRRIALRRGVSAEEQTAIFDWPQTDLLSGGSGPETVDQLISDPQPVGRELAGAGAVSGFPPAHRVRDARRPVRRTGDDAEHTRRPDGLPGLSVVGIRTIQQCRRQSGPAGSR